MVTLQWQGRRHGKGPRNWLLMDVDRKCSVAFAVQRHNRGAGGITAAPDVPWIEHRTGPSVHRLRQTIAEEIDRRSIGLFGDDDLTFLPSLVVS
jgi:hypothetical protein